MPTIPVVTAVALLLPPISPPISSAVQAQQAHAGVPWGPPYVDLGIQANAGRTSTSPAEMARMVVFAASDRAIGVTAQSLAAPVA